MWWLMVVHWRCLGWLGGLGRCFPNDGAFSASALPVFSVADALHTFLFLYKYLLSVHHKGWMDMSVELDWTAVHFSMAG